MRKFEVVMDALSMLTGAVVFATGVIIGAKLDVILSGLKLANDTVIKKVRRRNPFEGKNGLLSYRNLKYANIDYDEDDKK